MSSNIKYTGAKYVPTHEGDWDNTKNTEYSPLSVVLYQGASYTSKKAVPKGIDITNEIYWVKSADYNEQVAIYEENVRNYKTDSQKEINELINVSSDEPISSNEKSLWYRVISENTSKSTEPSNINTTLVFEQV